MGEYFQMFEAEAQKNPMLSPEKIKREKGEEFKVGKQVVPLIELAPK